MCGILAIHELDRAFNHKMLRSLRKRGPDEIGFWANQSVRIGHTRLSIIGLDDRAAQPMENDTHVIAFNGEIYNFIDIKRRLEGVGISLSGVSDTEVLLHAWSQWGPDILKDLEGFWAFIIYDKLNHKLFLVRDQFGIKPLYYWESNRGFGAASLLRTLLETVEEPPELDYKALSEYVRYQFTFGDKTFIKQIKKVLPGHIVEVNLTDSTVTSKCYEDILSAPPREVRRLDAEWIEQTRALLSQCALESTISDTSFTTFCSGGIDSSLITRLTQPEIAYHCNYSDPECNETFFAKQVVEGTDTRLFVVNAQEEFDLVARLQDIVMDFDELSIGSVILPLDDLLAQVKRRYKVILTGTGGDELFAGYVRYHLTQGKCFQDSYKALFSKMKQLPTPAERFEATHKKGDPKFFKFYDDTVKETFLEAFDACNADNDDLLAMLRFDRRYFLHGLLNIDDKMCGRHSLESRPSFLHQRFVRHVQCLDSNDLLSDDELKPVLRTLATGTLPETVVRRSDKMGFTTPIGVFVNHSSDHIREQIINSRFRDLYDLSRMNLTAENKFSREVFGLLMLDLWLNAYIGTK